MKINKENLKAVPAFGEYGRIIACAMYVANKIAKNGKLENTVHEQVADLYIKGKNTIKIAELTGFQEKTVRDAISDIQTVMGISE